MRLMNYEANFESVLDKVIVDLIIFYGIGLTNQFAIASFSISIKLFKARSRRQSAMLVRLDNI